MKLLRFLATTALIVLLTNTLLAQTNFQLSKTFKISGDGSWDYLAVQPNSNRLFISHGTQVNIIDKKTGDSIGIIPNTFGVHGIAFVPNLNKGYTTNGKTNNLTVFNLQTLEPITTIPTGEKPDGIFYESFSKKIIVCNGKSNSLSIIDPTTDKVVSTVEVGGKPEAAVSNEAGKIFVNIEDKNEIVVIDASKFQIIAHWSVSPGEAPGGLAIDTKTNRLFAACGDNNFLVILDATSGKFIDKQPIGGGCDGAALDPALKNIYTSNGDNGTVTVIHEDKPNKYTVVQNVVTKKGARTIAIDESTHAIYLPVAQTEPKKGKSKPPIIPNTFEVLMLTNQ